MVSMSNIICKTVGIAGMSAVVYDAYSMAHHHSMVGAEEVSADVFEKAVAAERSTSTQSSLQSAMQRKVANFRMSNPILPIVGKIKGFTTGFISGLGDNIVPITFASLALAAKGAMQKAGAWGLGLYAIYQVAKEGFGLGKHTPIDD